MGKGEVTKNLFCVLHIQSNTTIYIWVLVGKPEGKRPLGRPRRRWVYNIRMDLQEVGGGYVDWIGLHRIGTGGGRL